MAYMAYKVGIGERKPEVEHAYLIDTNNGARTPFSLVADLSRTFNLRAISIKNTLIFATT